MGYKSGEKEGGENHEIRLLRWELNQQYRGYEVKQKNIIMDILDGWCRDLKVELKELVGSKSKGVLHNMQKAVISPTLNISRTFTILYRSPVINFRISFNISDLLVITLVSGLRSCAPSHYFNSL